MVEQCPEVFYGDEGPYSGDPQDYRLCVCPAIRNTTLRGSGM